jgi:hypothetical protein
VPLSDEKIVELLKILDSLGELDAEELLGQFTGETIEVLRLVSGVLKEGMDLERVLSEKQFINVVKELYETKRIWSERLNETLGNAAQELDRGNGVQALWILNGFIRFCPSPYYRDMAGEVMGEYDEQE